MLQFFDKLEDRIRSFLSRRPLWYAFISGIGSVLFFRGVWMIADSTFFLTYEPWSGYLTLAISLVILLASGTFAFHFVSDTTIISGIKQEKKIIEKTEKEIRRETVTLREIKKEIKKLQKLLMDKRKYKRRSR